MDKPYLVTWKAGEVTLHASSEKEAVRIIVEYLLAQELIRAQKIAGEPLPEV